MANSVLAIGLFDRFLLKETKFQEFSQVKDLISELETNGQ